MRVSGSYFDPARDLTLEARWYQLLNTQKDLAVPFDPFFATLFELFPFYQITLLASKSWDDFVLQTGLDVRRVDDADDIGEFNRDFERYYFTTSIGQPLPWDLSMALTGEVWRSDNNDVQTWGVDVSRQLGKRWSASLGSFYSLFKYDFYLNEERDDIRVYYAYLRHRASWASNWWVRYEFEDNDIDGFHRLRLGYTWRF